MSRPCAPPQPEFVVDVLRYEGSSDWQGWDFESGSTSGITVKILVTFALENEFAPWRKMRSFARVAAEQWDHSYRKDFDGANVRVFLTGAGRFAAQREASIALEEPADICIAAGLSGGLRPEYRAGRVLTARQVANANGFLLADPDLVSAAGALRRTKRLPIRC